MTHRDRDKERELSCKIYLGKLWKCWATSDEWSWWKLFLGSLLSTKKYLPVTQHSFKDRSIAYKVIEKDSTTTLSLKPLEKFFETRFFWNTYDTEAVAQNFVMHWKKPVRESFLIKLLASSTGVFLWISKKTEHLFTITPFASGNFMKKFICLFLALTC